MSLADPIEVARLKTLSRYELTSGCMQAEMQDILELARDRFHVAAAVVSIVTEDAQVFAAHVGIGVQEAPRQVALCACVVDEGSMLLVVDALADARFRDNPLVTGEPFIRFYAGVPLRPSEGMVLGTLCLIDSQPQPGFGDLQLERLIDLSALVDERLEGRRRRIAARRAKAARLPPG